MNRIIYGDGYFDNHTREPEIVICFYVSFDDRYKSVCVAFSQSNGEDYKIIEAIYHSNFRHLNDARIWKECIVREFKEQYKDRNIIVLKDQNF